MQSEASVLSSVSKSTMQSFAAGLEKSQAESSHFASSADLYEQYFFSLISEANRSRKVSPFFRMIEFFFIYLQLILSAYNDFLPYEDTDSNYITFLKVFYIGFIGAADEVVPFIIALSVIDFITIAFFVICIIDYHVTHEYRKWMLYVLRIWHGHLFGVLLIPNFLMIMKGFAYLGLHNDFQGYIIVIITSILGCISIWHYLTILPFFSRTPYLSPSPVHAWDIKRIYKFLLISAIPMGLESFLNDQFETWIEIIPLFMMIGIFIYLIYELCSLPFKGIFFNALLFGCFNGVILGAAFSAAESISEGVGNTVFYSGPPILAVVSTIVIYFIIREYRKKVMKSLSYESFNEPGERPTEEMKKEQLDKLNLKNKKKSIMFIQIGFEEMCDMFVDWSLCKYLFDKFPADDDLIVFISWLVSLFPSEIQFLHKIITHGTKIVGISVDNRFLFFQIHRIHIFRQSSTSRETSNDFTKVKKVTDQTISAFCKYWLNLSKPNNEFNTSIYQGLAHLKQQAEAAWSEALDKYPNNPRFAKEHAVFLLEVGCQFKESLKQNQKALQLENGLRMQNDKTFHHFVLAYPEYLKKGIVDVKGNLKGPQINKNKNDAEMTSSSLMSTNHRSNSKSSSAINTDNSDESSSDQIDMQEGARFLPQMNLRLALQRAVNGLKAKTIKKIIISALLRAILTIAFILMIIFITKPLFDSRVDLFGIFHQMNKIQHTFYLMDIQIPWFLHEAVFEGKPDYSEFLEDVSSLWNSTLDDPDDTEPKFMKILNQFHNQINFSMTKRQIICDLALRTLNSMNEFNNFFYKIDSSRDLRLQYLSIFFYELQFGTYSCSREGDVIQSYFRDKSISTDYLIRTYLLQMRLMTLEPDESVKFWGVNSRDFCELMSNQQYISNLMKLISMTFSDSLYSIFEEEFGSLFNPGYNSRMLLEVSENRKEKILKSTLDIVARHAPTNLNTSFNRVKDFFEDENIKSAILEDVKSDYNFLKTLKKFRRKVKVQKTEKISLLEKIKLREENKTAFNYDEVFTPRNIALLLEEDEEEGDGDSEESVPPIQNTPEKVVAADRIDTICDFILALSPFILCLFILPSVIYLADGLDYEMTSFSNVLRNVSKADCLKAGERIMPVECRETQKKGKEKDRKKQQTNLVADGANSRKHPFWLFDVVSAAIIIMFFIILAIICKSTKNKIEECLQFYSLFMTQRNLLFSMNRDISFSLLFIECLMEIPETNLGGTKYANASALFYQALKDRAHHKLIHQIINSGDANIKSSIHSDSVINKIRFDSICSDDITSDVIIDYYKCTSLARTISYYIELIDSCVAQYQSTGKYYKLSSTFSPYLTHMLDTRIGTGFEQISERYKEIFDSKIKQFNTLLIVIPVISIIFTLLTYLVEMLLLVSASNQFSVLKSLMLRINPIAFVANNQLISLVYGKTARENTIVSASHAVFTTSPDAIISLNNEGVIEYLNPATTIIFGYTPEQMLGQNLKMLLNDDSKETSQLLYQMQLMQSGQTSLIYECELKGTRDDGTIIYLKVTLIGFTSSNGKIAENFGLMLRDMTNEITQKNAVEEAKKQSELLLLQILPKDIIMRLNRGDTDISFTVQSSTIAFIDIEKFSNYSASLSASEIMQNLGLVFTAYDKLLAKYNLIIKIKLIGDDYMLAAGLFNQDVEPSKHATQVVSFTLECLDAIEDLNEQLNASLQVRIGVNSGGPLIAGVLGTDKPLFDIIGDPINVASRLQSTDIPGEVQISQATYDFVANNPDFHIERRGEVELKGKGKQTTYLVHPHQRDALHEPGDDSQESIELQSDDANADEVHK